ncbi:MAG: 5'-nucleotidase, lipoprotein e(P4) family [Fusobacteriaceae bacterium]|jgi:5'-nucleotidase (lipoprotein e(P4) family)|nr:5'-nucleotidase, lipoprotein e(P4) family [Fusobacteriaceae bacterium]
MKKFKLCLILGVMCIGIGISAKEINANDTTGDRNLLISAVAWKQTAAEYKALYYQAFNIARLHLDNAIRDKKANGKPLAIITDVDDTILSANNYWGYLIKNNKDFFEDEVWDKWVPENKFTPMPGALEFFNYAKEKGVEIFYVTNRDQGEDTYKLATGNLKNIGFPFIDEKHLIVQRDTSNKEEAQQKIAQDYDVVVMLGDNLNDFQRKYYVKDIDERIKLMEEDKELYGIKYIVLPNPTDGHWIRAIFGDSEPPASDENRAKFKEAATRSSWEK